MRILIQLCLIALSATAVSALDVKGFPPTREVVYKEVDGHALKLQIFEPEGHKASDQRPAIVFFFGGGWNSGSPSQFHPHCAYLASRGMVAMSADYRVQSRQKTTPFECVKDGKSCMRYIRSHAAELGIDPDKLAIGGGSAGGHVAAAVATVPGLNEKGEDKSISTGACAMVLFNPVYNNGPGEYGHKRVEERWQEISPAHNIRKGVPPAIVFFGSKDPLVSDATMKAFQQAMKDVGSRSDLHIYDGRPHGFFNHGKGDGKDYLDTMVKTDAFLVDLGLLKAK
ncbi:MAG: acetyl esterase [Kiritimatiellia bacterium]|jgi:acetyl esterase